MSEQSETMPVSVEAMAVAAFYRTIMDELKDTALAHDLTMAYVASFNRRLE